MSILSLTVTVLSAIFVSLSGQRNNLSPPPLSFNFLLQTHPHDREFVREIALGPSPCSFAFPELIPQSDKLRRPFHSVVPIPVFDGHRGGDFGAPVTWWNGSRNASHRNPIPGFHVAVFVELPRSAIITSSAPLGMEFINDDKLS